MGIVIGTNVGGIIPTAPHLGHVKRCFAKLNALSLQVFLHRMVHAEITVAALVKRGSRFLVVEEEVRGARVINQPAGHLEPGETILDAVVRETREETAWRFTPTGLVGMYYFPHDDGRTTLRFAFCGNVDDHRAEQSLDDGIIQAHWLSLGELAAHDNLRSPLVLQSIHDLGAKPPLALDRIAHISG